jgi:hypothetical protein
VGLGIVRSWWLVCWGFDFLSVTKFMLKHFVTQSAKILILLSYFERPKMVRNALASVLRANELYPYWELAFIDDASSAPGKPIVEEMLQGYLDKVRFYNTNCTDEVSIFGSFMNQAIKDSDAELVLMLCDDDELCVDYLKNLNNYFLYHPSVVACYSHVYYFDPFVQKSSDIHVFDPGWLNAYAEVISIANHVDASQVAWRILCNKVRGCWFPSPKTSNLDAAFFLQLGEAPFSGLIGQYKGVHSMQLFRHDEMSWSRAVRSGEVSIDLP